MVGARLVAMVTSKAVLPFYAIGASTFKAPISNLILSMSLISLNLSKKNSLNEKRLKGKLQTGPKVLVPYRVPPNYIRHVLLVWYNSERE